MLSFPKGGVVRGVSYIPTARLWYTADHKRVVPEGHPDAMFLFCVPGRPESLAEASRLGLVREAAAEVKEVLPATKVIYPAQVKRGRGRPKKIR